MPSFSFCLSPSRYTVFISIFRKMESRVRPTSVVERKIESSVLVRSCFLFGFSFVYRNQHRNDCFLFCSLCVCESLWAVLNSQQRSNDTYKCAAAIFHRIVSNCKGDEQEARWKAMKWIRRIQISTNPTGQPTVTKNERDRERHNGNKNHWYFKYSFEFGIWFGMIAITVVVVSLVLFIFDTNKERCSSSDRHINLLLSSPAFSSLVPIRIVRMSFTFAVDQHRIRIVHGWRRTSFFMWNCVNKRLTLRAKHMLRYMLFNRFPVCRHRRLADDYK